jgi:hypothetical protein
VRRGSVVVVVARVQVEPGRELVSRLAVGRNVELFRGRVV